MVSLPLQLSATLHDLYGMQIVQIAFGKFASLDIALKSSFSCHRYCSLLQFYRTSNKVLYC
jgi:hypothetical protein